jgi:hypothetical protein
MVKNQYQQNQHPMSTFMPIPRTTTTTTTNSTFKFLPTKQQQQLNSLSSSTKSNKSAVSALSSLTTNSSSYRSSDGNVVIIEVGVDDVGIDVGHPGHHDHLCLGSTSPSSLSSSSDSPSSANSLSSKNHKINTDEFEMYSTETFESSSHSEERGIDCPEYFIPEVKQKPCYPPVMPQPQKPETNKFLKSTKSSSKSCKSEKAVKTPSEVVPGLSNATSRSNLLETCEVAAEQAAEVAVVTNISHFQSFGASSIRYIDEQSKANTPAQQPALPLAKADSQLEFSFETTTKNNYNEFSFVSPPMLGLTATSCKPKVQAKPSLSLETFENVINDLNEPVSTAATPGKISVGKRLFLEKQRSSQDTLDSDSKPGLAFTKRNSMKRGSSKRYVKPASNKSIITSINFFLRTIIKYFYS